MADDNFEDPIDIEQRMSLESERRRGAKPLPTSSKGDPVEASYMKQARDEKNAINAELRDDSAELTRTINRYRNPDRKVKDIVINHDRDAQENVDEFTRHTDNLYEQAEDTDRENQVLTAPGTGVHPDTIALRKASYFLMLVIIGVDGIGNFATIFLSGALSGGLMGAFIAGILPPAIAGVSGKACGDWFFPWAKQIHRKPLVGAGGVTAIIVTCGFVFIVVTKFSSFRDTVDAQAAEYLSLCLMGFNTFAFLMSFFIWSKTPPASPKLNLNIDRQIEISADIDASYFYAQDRLKKVGKGSLAELDGLEEVIAEEVDEVAEANDELSDMFDNHKEQLDSAQERFEEQINGHRRRMLGMSDKAKASPYLTKDADLSALFKVTFPYADYSKKTAYAEQSLTDLGSLIEAASDQIDEVRENAFAALKTQREKDPTL